MEQSDVVQPSQLQDCSLPNHQELPFPQLISLSKLNCNCGLQMDSSTYAFLHSYAGSAIGLWLGSKQGTAFLLYPGCLLWEGETSAVGTGLTKGIGT